MITNIKEKWYDLCDWARVNPHKTTLLFILAIIAFVVLNVFFYMIPLIAVIFGAMIGILYKAIYETIRSGL